MRTSTPSTTQVIAPHGAIAGTITGNVVTIRCNHGYIFNRHPEYAGVVSDTIQFYVADYFDGVNIDCEVYVTNNENANVIVDR